MDELAESIKERFADGLCPVYKNLLRQAKSKREIVDIALDANGRLWTAKKLACGELDPRATAECFAGFDNGRYAYENESGYSSSMYLSKKDGVIEPITSGTLIYGFDGTVRLNDLPRSLLLVDCNCHLEGNGSVYVKLYNSSITHSEQLKVITISD